MLHSKYYDEFNKENPLSEYPRPNLVRDSYLSLNGLWDFSICKKNEKKKYDLKIIVPYCPESIASGINKKISKDEVLYYRKSFKLDKSFVKDKVLLHLDSIDQESHVYINETLVSSYYNGYLPNVIDITKYIFKDKENTLEIKVIDKLSHKYPYGKQKNHRGGMWYTPVSGIWKTVWIESVFNDYVKDIKITPNIDTKEVIFEIDSNCEFSLDVYDGVNIIKSTKGKDKAIIKLDSIKLWSPESPFLYDVIIRTHNDEVKTYFAMRKFSVDDKYFLLNNKPYFIHGLLDQGYFVDGVYTPLIYKEYEDDIKTMKKLGFNTLRKHIKVEPLMFYHYCDKIGMIVFQDIVNNGTYSFVRDGIIPNIGIQKFLPNRKRYLLTGLFNKECKEIYKQNMIDTMNYLYSIPCIGYYTIFNEGWGEHEPNKYYHLAKKCDSTRIIDTTSGWFRCINTDVTSLHVYFKKVRLHKSKKPIMLSEFGGYAFKDNEHSYNLNGYYGYKKLSSIDLLNDEVYRLYENDIIGNIKNGLIGCIYTQVSDVEDEVNGILTYDRKVNKFRNDMMLKVKASIDEEFKRKVSN